MILGTRTIDFMSVGLALLVCFPPVDVHSSVSELWVVSSLD